MNNTRAKVNKTKNLFFEKMSNIDNQLVILIKKEMEKSQINKIRNEIRNIAEIPRSQETTLSNYTPIKWTTWNK